MPRRANPALESAWRRRLRQQLDSGLTIHEFCKRQGVSTASFHAWKRRLSLQAAVPIAPSRTAAFVPVVVSPFHEAHPRDSNDFVTIRLANGGQVLLPLTAGVEMVCGVVETVVRSTAIREGTLC